MTGSGKALAKKVDGADEVTGGEWAWGLAIAVAGLALRLCYLRLYRFDTDEPQHLHVVWGWAHGWVQYRDLFDNHTPLFHLLCAPLVSWLGDRADLLFWMRGAMVPLFLLILWLTYNLGQALYGRRAGWWGALVAGLCVPFFVGSVEFRADDLWALLWVLTVYLWVAEPITPKRAALVGLVLGATFSVSLKTVALVASAGLAAVVARARPHAQRAPNRRWRSAPALVAGIAVVPGVLVGWFAHLGALSELYADAVAHNLTAGAEPRGLPWRLALFLFGAVAVTAWAAVRRGRTTTDTVSPRREFVVLSAWYYLILVTTLWPLVTQQDFLPVWPLLVLPVVGRITQTQVPARHLVLIGLSLVELVWGIAYLPWRDRTGSRIAAQQAVLDLTSPDEFVLDRKGELIFRRRATPWVFERVTQLGVRRGTILPHVPEDLVRHQVGVVADALGGLPERAQKFVAENYLPVGAVRVLGQRLDRIEANGDGHPFLVTVPARYRILTPAGAADGVLDGTSLTGPRWLRPGWHRFVPGTRQGPWTILWDRAVAHGYGPKGLAPQGSSPSEEP